MKKILFVLILTMASHIYADTIPCPTPTHFVFNTKTWNIYLEKKICSIDENGPPEGYCTNEFLTYNSLTHKVDAYNSPNDHSKVNILKLITMQSAVTQNGKDIQLLCSGTYESSETEPGVFWGYWKNVSEHGNFNATLELNDYKKCALSTDNRSFECEK